MTSTGLNTTMMLKSMMSTPQGIPELMTSVTQNTTTYSKESSEFEQASWIKDFIVNKVLYYGIFTICSIGAINNVIVMLTMLMSVKLLNNSGGILIMALAFVDCSLNISVWIDFYDFYHHVINNFVYCVAYTYYWHITRSLTHLITMLISINRYALVCHPFTHRKVTSKKSALFQLLAVIIFSSVGCIYIFFSNDPNADFCTLDKRTIHIYFIAFNIMDSVFSNIVPLGVTIILATKILLALKKNKQLLEATGERSTKTQNSKSGTRVASRNKESLNDGLEIQRIGKKNKKLLDEAEEMKTKDNKNKKLLDEAEEMKTKDNKNKKLLDEAEEMKAQDNKSGTTSKNKEYLDEVERKEMATKNKKLLDEASERPETSQENKRGPVMATKNKESVDSGHGIPGTSKDSKSESVMTKKYKQSVEKLESPTKNKQGVRRPTREAEKNLTKALLAVNVAFIVLVLPFIILHTVYFLYYLLNETRSTVFINIDIAWDILYLIETLNYSINLFLYTWYSPVFKQCLYKLLACRCCRIYCKTD